jgi:hypothetical protein
MKDIDVSPIGTHRLTGGVALLLSLRRGDEIVPAVVEMLAAPSGIVMRHVACYQPVLHEPAIQVPLEGLA